MMIHEDYKEMLVAQALSALDATEILRAGPASPGLPGVSLATGRVGSDSSYIVI